MSQLVIRGVIIFLYISTIERERESLSQSIHTMWYNDHTWMSDS